MVARPVIVVAASLVAAALLGFIVWRAIPDIPKLDEPQTSEPEDEFAAVELGEYDDLDKEILRRFDEAPMTNELYSDGETYRLILFPAFDRPILIQARVDAAGPYLKTKIAASVEGVGKDKLGGLSVNEERPLTRDEWDGLRHLIEKADFWTAPVVDRAEVPMPDGASWFLYGNDFGTFHHIRRISPKPKQLLLFRYLLQLAGHEIDYLGYWSA